MIPAASLTALACPLGYPQLHPALSDAHREVRPLVVAQVAPREPAKIPAPRHSGRAGRGFRTVVVGLGHRCEQPVESRFEGAATFLLQASMDRRRVRNLG